MSRTPKKAQKLTLKVIIDETGRQINEALCFVKYNGIYRNGVYCAPPQPEVSERTVKESLIKQGYNLKVFE